MRLENKQYLGRAEEEPCQKAIGHEVQVLSLMCVEFRCCYLCQGKMDTFHGTFGTLAPLPCSVCAVI